MGRRFIHLTLLVLLTIEGTALSQTSQIDSRSLDLFETGQSAHELGRLDEAVRLYDEAIKLDPELWGAWFQKGVALVQLHRPAEAETALRRAIDLEADFAAAHAALGEALLELDRPKEAAEVLATALALNGELTEVRFNHALALVRAGRLTEAEKELARIESEKQETVDSVLLHAEVLKKLDRLPEALTCYTRALELDPKRTATRLDRGRLRLATDDKIGAEEDLAAVYSQSPTPDLARELLQLEVSLGRIERATELSNQLVEANPNDPAALVLAGDVMVQAAPLEAARFYVRAARLQPENVDFQFKLGAALVSAHKYAEAVEPLEFVLARSPERVEAHVGLGAALFSLDRFQEASHQFRWLSERDPNSPKIQFFLGASLDRIGTCQEALAAFEKFLTLADPIAQKNEIENVSLRVPALRRQIERGDCLDQKKSAKPAPDAQKERP